MSVLLTAGKRSVLKPKSAKPKKKKVPRVFNPTPPLSTDKTRVWHWNLQGRPTTVMFTADVNEVWCNGEIMDVISGFAEDPTGDGGVIDFCICLEDSDDVHKARIRRAADPSFRSGLTYQLYVEGYLVTEHTPEAARNGCDIGYQPIPPPGDQNAYYNQYREGDCAQAAPTQGYGVPGSFHQHPDGYAAQEDGYAQRDGYEESSAGYDGYPAEDYSQDYPSQAYGDTPPATVGAGYQYGYDGMTFAVPDPPTYDEVMEEDKKTK